MKDADKLREIDSLPPEAQRELEEFIESLHQRYGNLPPTEQSANSNLRGEGFVGMWQDRSEVSDSSEWVRKLRESEWGN